MDKTVNFFRSSFIQSLNQFVHFRRYDAQPL
jgi:hypothetical protein